MRVPVCICLLFLSFLCIGQDKTHHYRVIQNQLQKIYAEDQESRSKIDYTEKEFGPFSQEYDDLFKTIAEKDSVNMVQVSKVLDDYGWLGEDEIGELANITLFLVIQHAGLREQEKYLPMMREAVKDGKAGISELALLEDRVALGQGKKQIYGSQVMRDDMGKLVFAPIEDEEHLNERRARVGLASIEEHAEILGIDILPGGIVAPHTNPFLRYRIFILLPVLLLAAGMGVFYYRRAKGNQEPRLKGTKIHPPSL
jgi:hypothetical protein